MTMDNEAINGDDVDLDEGVMRADSDDEKDPKAEFNISHANTLTLKEQARQLVINVRDYFLRERNNEGPLISTDLVLERTSAALRLKSPVVARICQRWGHRNSVFNANGTHQNASNNRYHPLRIDAIKNFVNMYYRTDPTASMSKAHDKLVRSGLFRGSQTTLRRMLQKEGFDFVRTGSRCDAFRKVAPEFIFEEYTKPDKEEEEVDEQEKTRNLEPICTLDCEKEDLEFFRCVLPSVAKLNDSDKLNFRLAVMGKVQNILYVPPPKAVARHAEATTEPTMEVTPEPTTELMPEPTTELMPEATTEVTPEATTEVTPEATTEVMPEATTEVTPEATTEVTPGAATEVTPEATTEVTPGATTEVTPGAATEVRPEATTEVTPEAQ